MSLKRIWTPSGNNSNGSTKRLIVLHTMEGFTGTNGAYDCAKYFQTDCGASSQVCIDNNRGTIWECVSRGDGAWTQCGYNSESVSAEQSGFASWSRDYWLSNRENELRNTADWIREEAGILGIPIRALTSGEAQGGGTGITQHMHLGSTGCGHSDCGSNYPIDKVIEWAKGSSAITTGSGDMTSAVAFDKNGEPHFACVGTNNKVYYKAFGSGWLSVDPGSNVKSGLSIAVDPSGRRMISYVNQNGEVCTYECPVGESVWAWCNRGGDAR